MGLEFVRPTTAILNLPSGNNLIVKARLSHGEYQEALAQMAPADAEGIRRVDRLRIAMGTILAYLVDWDVEDDGRPVQIRGLAQDDVRQVLNGLAPESFDEIKTAIEAHEAAVAERHAKKKTPPAGENGPGPISGSPSEPAGVSSGSGS
jgi:hypothetical protein